MYSSFQENNKIPVIDWSKYPNITEFDFMMLGTRTPESILEKKIIKKTKENQND